MRYIFTGIGNSESHESVAKVSQIVCILCTHLCITDPQCVWYIGKAFWIEIIWFEISSSDVTMYNEIKIRSLQMVLYVLQKIFQVASLNIRINFQNTFGFHCMLPNQIAKIWNFNVMKKRTVRIEYLNEWSIVKWLMKWVWSLTIALCVEWVNELKRKCRETLGLFTFYINHP